MTRFLAKAALLPAGWAQDVLITTDENGWIEAVEAGQAHSDAITLGGPVIPGMPNLHSHAFQRAMAGLTEYATADKDSFWTWRKLMYDFLQKLGPDELVDIATKLYREMLAAGYTHVGEFHYIHHAPDGSAYEDSAHLAHCMIRAAKTAGIGITMLPVLYAYSGFGSKAPIEGQKRFINTPEQYLDIIASLYREYQDDPQVRIGAAFHSLRAVSPEMITEVTQALNAIDPRMPIHIHIAEQEKEVQDCLEWSGHRPVSWLFDHAPVDSRWCLVHATHMDDSETRALAQSGAVAGLCPVTEANLGDGLFDLPDYIREGGSFGIGSDSHISVDPVEELRWLEYGQRLVRKERAVARTDSQPHVGDFLYSAALKGGAQALGGKIGALEAGCRADFLVLGPRDDMPEQVALLDSFLFAGTLKIAAVYAGGKQI
ncbi:MAG: formimidoylglutamate deiminase [Chloroflexi bacterium]|nr:formimidoylglutamate deiminase [Chloroflexota bacterium]